MEAKVKTIIDDKLKTIHAIKTKPPKMNGKGRTWDYVGKVVDFNLEIVADTTWGIYGYFVFNENWYKFKMIG